MGKFNENQMKAERNGMTNSDGSGLPEPESPTGFSRFLEAREGPSPTFFKKAQPEGRPSPNFYDFGKPEARPKPTY